ncbi:MAG: Minor allergen Cla h 7, partial [Candelina submexicana]
MLEIPLTLPSLCRHASLKDSNIPFLNNPPMLESYDAFLFGILICYGNFPAQWKTFWDKMRKQWATGIYWGKYAGIFMLTGTAGGGQESTVIVSLSTLSHLEIIYAPLGYKEAFLILSDLSEVQGRLPWGAGTFSAGDGSRQLSEKELQLPTHQGKVFYQAVAKVNF